MKLNLGCGFDKQPGYTGIDIVKTDKTDIVHDCEKGLPFDDNTIEEVLAYDFLEHISNPINIMNEIWRVLKPDGIFKFKIPDAEKGQGSRQDPTHKSFWTLNSFKYYVDAPESEAYKKLYGIKARFKIEKLDSIEYDAGPFWGKNFALVGEIRAIKKGEGVKNERVVANDLFTNLNKNNVVFTTDDLCLSNLEHFRFWDKVKEKRKDLKVIAFTIACKDYWENLEDNDNFVSWFNDHKDWVTIGLHGYDHKTDDLQEGWRDDQEEFIKNSLRILGPYLPKEIIYRAPGFRTLPKTEGILKKLGIAGIAHRGFIKMFDSGEIIKTFDTHCTLDQYENPIGQIWQQL